MQNPPREYLHAQLIELAQFINESTDRELTFAFDLISTCGCWHCKQLVSLVHSHQLCVTRSLWLYTIHSGILYPPYKPYFDTSLN